MLLPADTTFDWPSRAATHVLMLFAFRSEFRPLVILQFIFSPVSHPYRGNTTILMGLVGFGVLVLFWVFVFFGLLCGLLVLFCVALLINVLCSLSILSLADLQ